MGTFSKKFLISLLFATLISTNCFFNYDDDDDKDKDDGISITSIGTEMKKCAPDLSSSTSTALQGLSIFFPKNKNIFYKYKKDYFKLDFTKKFNYGWKNFLINYFKI